MRNVFADGCGLAYAEGVHGLLLEGRGNHSAPLKGKGKKKKRKIKP